MDFCKEKAQIKDSRHQKNQLFLLMKDIFLNSE